MAGFEKRHDEAGRELTIYETLITTTVMLTSLE